MVAVGRAVKVDKAIHLAPSGMLTGPLTAPAG